MKTKSVLMAACAVAALTSAVAHAGYQYQYASCVKEATGAGRCWGNLLGWRNSSGVSDEVRFTINSNNYRFFSATHAASGTNISCVPTASVAGLWDQAMLHGGYFYIQWDASGNCNYLLLDNGSAFSNF